MARLDLTTVHIVKEDLPSGEKGKNRIGIKPYEMTNALPTPLSELFQDSFSQMQLQLAVGLNSTREFPYFRAVLAERLLCDLEEYCRRNSVRSDALGVFLPQMLLRLTGDNRFFNDLVWKDVTLSAHWNETPNPDAPPVPMPGGPPVTVNRKELHKGTKDLVKQVKARVKKEKKADGDKAKPD